MGTCSALPLFYRELGKSRLSSGPSPYMLIIYSIVSYRDAKAQVTMLGNSVNIDCEDLFARMSLAANSYSRLGTPNRTCQYESHAY